MHPLAPTESALTLHSLEGLSSFRSLFCVLRLKHIKKLSSWSLIFLDFCWGGDDSASVKAKKTI